MGVEAFDPEVTEIIRTKVKKFMRKFPFLRHEQEDLEQTVTVHVVQGMKRHDPARGSPGALANVIAESKLLSEVAKSTAAKRDRRGDVHLDEEVVDGAPRSELDLNIDIKNTIEGLPPELRRLALLLQEHLPAKAGRLAGLTPAQLRTQVSKLRGHFGSREDFL